MKLGIFGAMVVLAVPLAAAAQSPSQKKADLEEALRVRQFICDGIRDVSARGGTDYSAADLSRCLALLDEQRAEYAALVASDAHPSAAAQRPAQIAGVVSH